MSELTARNASYADALKGGLMLSREPVAVKLVRAGDPYPCDFEVPEKQHSHCQAVLAASAGGRLKVPADMQGCNVGASCLGMKQIPEKIATGEFHCNIGMHDTPAAAKAMIDARTNIEWPVDGEVVCPLRDADFEPDVVVFVDVPERIYWFTPLLTHATGGRVFYSTAPFQCICEDCTVLPMTTGLPNLSLGCFGCRRKTDIKPTEMAIGVPYARIADMVAELPVYENGIFKKAKRD